MMKTDAQLQYDVIAELKWDTSVNATKIGVEVSNGIVTLSGHVDNFGDKWSAEKAAQKVCGVKAKRIQEIWSFTYAKQKNVARAKAAPADAGDTLT